MNEKELMDLKDKVIDLKRFAFILIALSGFLSVGLILPTDSIATEYQGLVVGIIAVLLVGAVWFHRAAMRTQKIVNEEEF
ncbi:MULTISPECIES: YrhC family protein [Bacillaceae]|uniref:YrhC family protein n=1 Tax=Evansella alkalicola TaxID=745819 RepID=A0ABS6JVZ0_9BACI|nr:MULTISPECIES: YrhC family protein [Bacillaceae]MBU9722560.1 YrhC family protein [Bacillus alkalicola]